MSRDSLRADDLNRIEANSDMVYRMAYSLLKHRQDAEDIHQEVFLRYLKKKPDFESAEHEKAWFLRVTVNLCKNYWKTAWKRKVVNLGEEELEGIVAEEQNDLIEIVGRLPQKYRIVIHLFYYEDMTVEEISGVLGTKPSTVRTQLTRARSRLKELLEG